MADRSYEATRWSLDDLLPATAGPEFEHFLEEAGIDVTSPTFWQGGFDVIRDLIRQLEEVSA